MALQLGVTLYSFNVDYYTYRYSLQDCFAAVGSLGEGQGVEVVAPQMIRGFPHLSSEFEYTFRKLVDQYGLRPSAYGAYMDRERYRGRLANRDDQIDYLRLQIRAAARLGFPVIRTPVAESAINDLLPYAEKYDVKIAMEIHSPITVESIAPAIEKVQKINSPYLGFCPDSGAFCHSPAAIYVQRFQQQGVPQDVIDLILKRWSERASTDELRREVAEFGGGPLGDLMAIEAEVYFGHGDPNDLRPLMPYINHVHGKFYGIDETGTDSAVRFPEIVSVLIEGGYDGFISCEYEGHHWDTELSAIDQIRTVQSFLARRIAETEASMTNLDKHFDAIVVGSGATGSIAVKELTERGLEVLLLEAGRDISEEDFAPLPEAPPRAMGIGLLPRAQAAILRRQPVQVRRAFFSEKTTPFLVNDLQNPYSSRGQDFLWVRGRQLGGRLHSYGRVLLRSSDYDFEGGAGRDRGAPAWPIRYADLEPWYDRVEEFMGLYGNDDDAPILPDGRYIGPSHLTAAERDFAGQVEGRWPERRVIAWRYAAPNLDRVPLGILAARRTGRLTIRTDAVVSNVSVDEKTGLADGVVFVDRRTKKRHHVSSDIVMLCASTIESIRLLQNSGSTRHPDGLANSSGLVGSYFMDQTPALVFGDTPRFPGWEDDTSAPADNYYGPAGGLYIPMIEDFPRSSDFVGGYAVQGMMGRMPVPEDHPGSVGMMAFGEMLPYRENSVTIHKKRKDAWGVPIPQMHIHLTDNERSLLREQVRGVREMVESAGVRVNFAGSTLGLDSRKVFPNADPFSRAIFRMAFTRSLAIGAAIHECGGARMGDDPATSVLNPFNQTWDVPNLFITDASSYPTNGIVGPTLTIMALTARACEYAAKEHAAGNLTKNRVSGG